MNSITISEAASGRTDYAGNSPPPPPPGKDVIKGHPEEESGSSDSNTSSSDEDSSDEECMSGATAIRVWRQHLKRSVNVVRLHLEKEAGDAHLRVITWENAQLANYLAGNTAEPGEGGDLLQRVGEQVQMALEHRGEGVLEAMEAPSNLAGAIRRVAALHRFVGEDWEDWEDETQEDLDREIEEKQRQRRERRLAVSSPKEYSGLEDLWTTSRAEKAAKATRKLAAARKDKPGKKSNKKFFTTTEARAFWSEQLAAGLKLIQGAKEVETNREALHLPSFLNKKKPVYWIYSNHDHTPRSSRQLTGRQPMIQTQ